MNTRLKEIRLAKKLSQKDLAKILKLSQNHVSALEHGTRNLTERIIDDVVRELNVNREWLITGEGECFKNTLDSYTDLDSKTKDLVENFMQLDEESKGYVLGLIDKLLK
ncbi:MAG: helix-turn-helix domain-containing protein [Sarcina sp.]